MLESDLPESTEMRWPILVVLDEMGEDDAVLDLQDRVAERLGLSDDARDVVSADTGRSALTERLIQAFADLNAAGAVEADNAGALRVTDAGRRLTELDVQVLPRAVDEPEDSQDRSRASFLDYVVPFLPL